MNVAGDQRCEGDVAVRAGGGEGGATGTITRAAVVALGRSADPWAFVPLAVHALTIAPEDHEVRFLLAAAYAKLGLKTAATESLGVLAHALGGASHPAVQQMAAVVGQLPDDRVPLAKRLRTLERNLAALAKNPTRAVDLRHVLGAWAEHAAKVDAFNARGGNMLLREADGRWVRFADDVSLARKHVPEATPGAPIEPLLFDGIFPPWVFARAAEYTPTRADGQRTRLTIVEPDLMAFVDSISLTDVSAVLSEARVEAFVGEGASSKFAESLEGRAAFYLGKTCFNGVPLGRRGTPAGRSAGQLLMDARDRQDARFATLTDRGETVYSGRDRAWWAARFDDAISGGTPLRVLIPTSRYTTYVRHSCEDLAEALRALGCDVRVLKEPDDASKFSAIAFWNEYVEWQPDLIIAINYTRGLLPGGAPRHVPCVMWIQDQAQHLFSASATAGLGEMDFVVGYLIPALFEQLGFPTQRTRFLSSPVSQRKFHAASVGNDERSRFACEIGYVSHHGEPMEHLLQALVVREPIAEQNAVLPALRDLVTRLGAMALEGLTPRTRQWLRAEVRETLQQALRRTFDEARVSGLVAAYGYPIAERVLRHQMLEWAAELCDERGWRLHIYGRGWDRHPRFARFARGELKHGDDLRAAYQCARVHLHAGMGAPIHQRIMECALSGGATLTRLKGDDPDVLHQWWAMGAEFASPDEVVTPPPRWDEAQRRWIVGSAARPTTISRDIHARLGISPIEDHPQDAEFVFPTSENPWPVHHGTPVTMQDALLVGDYAETTFWSRETFRVLATRAIESDAFRAGLGAWQRDSSLARFTYDIAAREILDTVRHGLATSAG